MPHDGPSGATARISHFVSAPQGDLSDPILVALKMVYFPCIWILKIVAGKIIGKTLVCTLRSSHLGVGGWVNGRGLVGLTVTLKNIYDVLRSVLDFDYQVRYSG